MIFCFCLLAGRILPFILPSMNYCKFILLCCSFAAVVKEQSCECTWRADAGRLWLVLGVLDKSCCFEWMSVADSPDELNFSSFQAKSHFSACYYLLNLFNETSCFIVCSFHSCSRCSSQFICCSFGEVVLKGWGEVEKEGNWWLWWYWGIPDEYDMMRPKYHLFLKWGIS